jgi:hypothetical protein
VVTLAVKTTVLFEPRQYRELKRIAAARGQSVGELIRSAVAEKYGLGDRAARLAAVAKLNAMSAPVGDWPEMEADILRGARG